MKGFTYIFVAIACFAAVGCQDQVVPAYIAGDGDFGSVCIGDFHDLDVTFLCVDEGIENSCTITSLQLSSSEFELPQYVEESDAVAFADNFDINEDSYITFPVRYRPTTTGFHTGTLSIGNPDGDVEDTVLQIRGFSGEGVFNVAFESEFGDVCFGDFRDQDMTILNEGNCSAIITGIATSGPEFEVAGGISYPITLDAGSSIAIPVRFTPPGVTDFVTGSIDIGTSAGGVTDTLQIGVRGRVPFSEIRAAIADSGNFGGVCLGDFKDMDLTILNQGKCDLTVSRISLSAVSANYEIPSDLVFNVTLGSGSDIRFPIRFIPSDPSTLDATLEIESNNAGVASSTTQISLTGVIPQPEIRVAIADSGSFGGVCVGDFKDLDLTILNQGKCDLEIVNLSLQTPSVNYELPSDLAFNVTLGSGSDIRLPIRFIPTNPTSLAATLEIESNNLGIVASTTLISLTGVIPPPEIRVAIANSGFFGEVCVGDCADLDLTILNQGGCDLNISDISSSNPDFDLPDDLVFDLYLGPGTDFRFPIRYCPSVGGSLTGVVSITSNMGVTPLDITLTAAVPDPEINVAIADSGYFGSFCEGDIQDMDLTILNQGECDLTIVNISMDDGTHFELPTDWFFNMTLEPGTDFRFPVRFAPKFYSVTPLTDIVEITSSDPIRPTVLVDVTGRTAAPEIKAAIADTGYFGEVCEFFEKDLDLTILNQGECELNITDITIDDIVNFTLPSDLTYPLLLAAGTEIRFPVRFQPEAYSPDLFETTVTVFSNDPVTAELLVNVSGVTPPPDINVAIADSGFFGTVCVDQFKDLDLTLFNQGHCELNITNLTIVDDPINFLLPTDLQLPLILAWGSDFRFPVRFAPLNCSDEPFEARVEIVSNDPDESPLYVNISGLSPCDNLFIDIGRQTFPPTVVDEDGIMGCYSEIDVAIRNRGLCPVTITNVNTSIPDFEIRKPSFFPIILPGGEETLLSTVRFIPQSDSDPNMPYNITGEIQVWEEGKDFPATEILCGESVAQSGFRLLVTDYSKFKPEPIENVDVIKISTFGENQPSPLKLTWNKVQVNTTTICGREIKWHINQESLASVESSGANKKSAYVLYAKHGNLQKSMTVFLDQCQFRDLHIQLKDSGPGCLLGDRGAFCQGDGECCSGRCFTQKMICG